MFLGLRMTEGVSEKFKMDFGRNIDAVYGKVIEKLENSTCWKKRRQNKTDGQRC
ncbi:MAG: hypothetical protein ACLT2Z_06390 [Eubacterium sp.]